MNRHTFYYSEDQTVDVYRNGEVVALNLPIHIAEILFPEEFIK